MVEEILLGCKNLDQARSDRPKTVDFELVLQAIESNPESNPQIVPCNLGISQSNVVHHFHNLNKSILSSQIVLHITKLLQNF